MDAHLHASILGAGPPLFFGVSPLGVLADVGRSLREALYMAWDTLWALVLGFTLSGAVQAFASQRGVARRLGNHRPASIARASLYGMASSSCSYAASAMARSLVIRGADYLAAMVFMFASTNLVIELGIVLAVLVGWQFVAAEAVGGVVMIMLLVLLGGLWLRGRAVAGALSHAVRAEPAAPPGTLPPAEQADDRPPGARSAAGWSRAAGYAMGDLTMLRREMVVGFVLAGFLTVLVPTHVWSDVFLRGHGAWTDVENAAVGPLVALVSCVCSVGNVPLAAALWHGGVTFGGVVAFVFADLIALPLLFIYKRQYGGWMALRMLGAFWVVMSVAGLVTGALFGAAGLEPVHRVGIGLAVGDSLRWDWTTGLDIAAILLLAALIWLDRNRARFDSSARYAKDPVCGMQVEVATAPASAEIGGIMRYFCSTRCADRARAGAGIGIGGHTDPPA